jgi:hypothetical protein
LTNAYPMIWEAKQEDPRTSENSYSTHSGE